jgi:hypothetical protein
MTELAQKFADFQIPTEFRRGFGSRNFIKMMMFANDNQLTNDNIDYYMACPPYRMEDESYDDMKVRTKFANALLKYRSKLYDYSVYENN